MIRGIRQFSCGWLSPMIYFRFSKKKNTNKFTADLMLLMSYLCKWPTAAGVYYPPSRSATCGSPNIAARCSKWRQWQQIMPMYESIPVRACPLGEPQYTGYMNTTFGKMTPVWNMTWRNQASRRAMTLQHISSESSHAVAFSLFVAGTSACR